MAKDEAATTAAGPDGGIEARWNQRFSKVGCAHVARPMDREHTLPSKRAGHRALTAYELGTLNVNARFGPRMSLAVVELFAEPCLVPKIRFYNNGDEVRRRWGRYRRWLS